MATKQARIEELESRISELETDEEDLMRDFEIVRCERDSVQRALGGLQIEYAAARDQLKRVTNSYDEHRRMAGEEFTKLIQEGNVVRTSLSLAQSEVAFLRRAHLGVIGDVEIIGSAD